MYFKTFKYIYFSLGMYVTVIHAAEQIIIR